MIRRIEESPFLHHGEAESEESELASEKIKISLKTLDNVLAGLGLSEDWRQEICYRAHSKAVEEEEKEKQIIEGEVADRLLAEVLEKVVGLSPRELSPSQLKEVERIRHELGVKGEFRP